MLYRLLVVWLAISLSATAQTLTLDQLSSFLKSSVEMKQSDREVAGFLAKAKLSERLDDRTIEQLQSLGIGPKTVQALERLRDQSQSLPVGAPVQPVAAPRPIPPPTSEEQGAIIDEVRRYALHYSAGLPDYICTRVTRRYAAAAPGTRYGGRAGGDPSWSLQDTLTIRLSYFEQKEEDKLILVNNTLSSQDYGAVGGATSTGEFGALLRDIFEPRTQTRFEWDHWATLRGRRAMAFAYHVAQANSEWHVNYERRLDMVPAYRGLVYVDKDTHEVLRVTLEAENIPPEFPVHQVETVLDYDYQKIGDHGFLLPLKSSANMRTSDVWTRNDDEFRLYRKFSAESEVKYDTPPPLPEDQTSEQPQR